MNNEAVPSMMIEMEEVQPREAWLVDDSESLAFSILRLAKIYTGEQVNFRYYQTGKVAVSEYENRLASDAQLPELILMDYQLDQGVANPEYRTGETVVRDLLQLSKQYGANMPEIIAFSSDPDNSEKLIGAGATKILDKNSFSAIKEYFGNLKSTTELN